MKKFEDGDRVKDKFDNTKGKVLLSDDAGVLVHFDGYEEAMHTHAACLVKLKPKKPLREFKIILDKDGYLIRGSKDSVYWKPSDGESMIYVREVRK